MSPAEDDAMRAEDQEHAEGLEFVAQGDVHAEALVILKRHTFASAVQTTTNTYVDLGPILTGGIRDAATGNYFMKGSYRSTVIQVVNTGGTNNATVQILGSVDGADYGKLSYLDGDATDPSVNVVETVVPAASTKLLFLATDAPFIKLQVKSSTGGAHTTVKGNCIALPAQAWPDPQ